MPQPEIHYGGLKEPRVITHDPDSKPVKPETPEPHEAPLALKKNE